MNHVGQSSYTIHTTTTTPIPTKCWRARRCMCAASSTEQPCTNHLTIRTTVYSPGNRGASGASQQLAGRNGQFPSAGFRLQNNSPPLRYRDCYHSPTGWLSRRQRIRSQVVSTILRTGASLLPLGSIAMPSAWKRPSIVLLTKRTLPSATTKLAPPG